MAAKGKGAKGHVHQQKQDDSQYDKMEEPLDEQELESLYSWVDGIPLSRPKKSIQRDFADGVLVAEIMHHFFPKLVDMHNYSKANKSDTKTSNWERMNKKVFAKMNFELAEDVISDLVNCKPGMIEKVLLMLQVKIKRAEYARGRQNDKPEADQHLSSPGRKAGGPVRVDMDNIKGSRFLKTKQTTMTRSKLEFRYPTKSKGSEKASGDKKHVQFDEKKEKSNDKRLQEQKPPPKKAPSNVIPKRRPGPIVESDLVPRYLVEEKEQEVLTRDETIQMLSAKVNKLEHLLQLKDRCIAELSHNSHNTQFSTYPGLPSTYASASTHHKHRNHDNQQRYGYR